MQWCLSVSLFVCLSRGSTRLHYAKTAERIKMLFGVNTLGAHGTLWSWSGVLIPHRQGRGTYFWILGPPCISGTAEARDLTYTRLRIVSKITKSRLFGGQGGVTWATFKFCDCLYLRNGYSYRILRVQCVRCIRCSLCQITLASCLLWAKSDLVTRCLIEMQLH